MKKPILLTFLTVVSILSLNASSNTNHPHSAIDDRAPVTKESLLACFPEEDGRRNSANKILDRIFESMPRDIMEGNENPFGFAFACNPEFLLPLLRNANGKAVCEIAGASGEHALLFLLAGASSATVNDINKAELVKCNSLYEQHFSNKFKKKTKGCLELIPGDCFDVFNSKHESMYDIVLARNIIHFFTDPQRSRFFKLLSDITKVDGLVHIVTSANKDFGPDVTCVNAFTLFNRHPSGPEPIGDPYFFKANDNEYKCSFSKEIFLTSVYPNAPVFHQTRLEYPKEISDLADKQLRDIIKYYTDNRIIHHLKGIRVTFDIHAAMNRFYRPETLLGFFNPASDPASNPASNPASDRSYYEHIQSGLVNSLNGHLAGPEDRSISSAVTVVKKEKPPIH